MKLVKKQIYWQNKHKAWYGIYNKISGQALWDGYSRIQWMISDQIEEQVQNDIRSEMDDILYM